jgi:hypothetical protein
VYDLREQGGILAAPLASGSQARGVTLVRDEHVTEVPTGGLEALVCLGVREQWAFGVFLQHLWLPRSFGRLVQPARQIAGTMQETNCLEAITLHTIKEEQFLEGAFYAIGAKTAEFWAAEMPDSPEIRPV